MIKKLMIAPAALSIALLAVTPGLAQAEETTIVATNSAIVENVNFNLIYNGAVSSYTAMFGTASVEVLSNDSYRVTLEVPNMLTTFEVNGTTPTLVEENDQYNVYQFTTTDLANIPIYIEYNVGYYVGKHTMTLVIDELSLQ